MIISHKYKFIYLRTEKTGSTSIQHVLKKLIEAEQIESYEGALEKFIPIGRQRYGSLRRANPHLFGFHAHPSARHVRQILGSEIFDSYFKFTVERNPWDRQVSLYFHREFKRRNAIPNFDWDMKTSFYRFSHYCRLRNWEVYSIDNRIIVDRVIKYDNLDQEIREIFSKLGIQNVIEMPRLNKSYSGCRDHYSKYYSDETRALIQNWYRPEIEAFGFQFEDLRNQRATF